MDQFCYLEWQELHNKIWNKHNSSTFRLHSHVTQVGPREREEGV